MRRGVIERYRARLRVPAEAVPISLDEGSTPLIEAPRLAERLGHGRVWLKVEGANPTGSFKDRGMTVAVTLAVHEGHRGVICASTGNTSASAAAYAARAGLKAFVVLPAGHVALGKLVQAVAHGARVIAVEGNFDAALELVRAAAARHDLAIVNSINPARIAGQKTAAYEVIEALGDAPDLLAIPVGNAGNVTAYGQGFEEARSRGEAGTRTTLLGFQARGAAPFVHGAPIDTPETVASAIRIGRPASWTGARRVVDASGGGFHAVSDAAILEAQATLARGEGVFAEPSSAAPVAGLLELAARGELPRFENAVIVLTGHGLKDPEAVLRDTEPPRPVPATAGALDEVIAAELGGALPPPAKRRGESGREE
jgi:threonine synthase